MDWIFSRETTKLSINAILDIAKNRKVKHILGIGEAWSDIMQRLGYRPSETVVISGQQRFSFKFYKYKISENATPIVISILGSGSIKLPANPEAVQKLRYLLELDPKFSIQS